MEIMVIKAKDLTDKIIIIQIKVQV